jgi:hypothetical protein
VVETGGLENLPRIPLTIRNQPLSILVDHRIRVPNCSSALEYATECATASDLKCQDHAVGTLRYSRWVAMLPTVMPARHQVISTIFSPIYNLPTEAGSKAGRLC